MTYHVKKVKIKKFRGKKDFSFDFDRKTNFFIGINGSGKTTLIKLLKSAIEIDESLLEMPAEELVIEYIKVGEPLPRRRRGRGRLKNIPEKPSLKIVKSKNKEEDSRTCSFFYKDENTKGFVKMKLPDTEGDGESFFHTRWGYESLFNRLRREYTFARYINLAWFSIQRTNTAAHSDGEFEDFDLDIIQNPLDNRLREVISVTSSYLSQMDSKYKASMDSFQKDYLGAVVKMFEKESLDEKEINLESLKTKMINILDILDINSTDIEIELDKITKIISAGTDGGKIVDYIIALSTAKKIAYVIERWEATQKSVADIFAPRDEFIDAMNQFFQTKSMGFRETNQPFFKMNGEKQLHNFGALSSGEKQLLTFMLETLNQKSQSYIYI